MSTRNEIVMTIYHYADSCSPPMGLCQQFFPSALSARDFLVSQGYTSIGVNEYVRNTAVGGGRYYAVLQDMRPASSRSRRDWRRLEFTHTENGS